MKCLSTLVSLVAETFVFWVAQKLSFVFFRIIHALVVINLVEVHVGIKQVLFGLLESQFRTTL